MATKKDVMTLRLNANVKKYLAERSEETGLSMAMYVEQFLRKEIEERGWKPKEGSQQ